MFIYGTRYDRPCDPGNLAVMSIANLRSRAYLSAAESAFALLGEPIVSAWWTRASVLRHFSVGGLAAHLAQQILTVPEVLIAHTDDAPAITLFEHYQRSGWNDADPESTVNREIRITGERAASDGPESVLAQVHRALGIVHAELTDATAVRTVFLPWEGWSLTRDDFLLTRTVELVVHADDLAVSVGMQSPELPGEALELVIDLLGRMAMYKHGPIAVLRALSRTERAPETIAAI